ncbi:MAG: hypothetical protein JNK04_05160 [Myxococcales bacterium]|nr:hypothetical protein [Myxococcales bacterium]
MALSLRTLPPLLALGGAVALTSLGCPPSDLPVSISEGALDSILDVCTAGAPTEDCIASQAALDAFFGTASALCLRSRCDDDGCGGGNDCPPGLGPHVHAAVRVALVAREGDGDEPQAIALSRCVELGAQANGALDPDTFSSEFSSAVDAALAGGLHYEDFEDLEEAYVLSGFFTWLDDEPSAGLGESDGCTADRIRVASELTLAGNTQTLDVACASCRSRQSVEFPSHCLDSFVAGSKAKCFFDATAEVLGLCEPGGKWITSAGSKRCDEAVE